MYESLKADQDKTSFFSSAKRWISTRKFSSEEIGAVTIDFIVITASIVVLGTVIVNMTKGGQERIANQINDSLSSVQVSE